MTVVIPNWNRRDLLVKLMDLLAGQTLPPAAVLVVDNGSSDDSAEEARTPGRTGDPDGERMPGSAGP